jgi:hypothetical protein
MKAKETASLIALLVLIWIVIILSNKLHQLDQSLSGKVKELDRGVTRLSNEMNAAATKINSMLQPKASATVGGFGCGSTLS